MTRDDIIKMAREAGLAHFHDSEGHCTGITDSVLVDADKERDDERLVQMLMPFAALVAAAEREACAKVVEILIPEQTEEGLIGHTIAKAIRERGLAPYTTPPVQEFVCSTGFCRFTLTQTDIGLGEVKKRGWVGLTDEEIDAIVVDEVGLDADADEMNGLARAIEAKLKEKNT